MSTKIMIKNLITNISENDYIDDEVRKHLVYLIKARGILLLHQGYLKDGSKQLKWLYDTIATTQEIIDNYELEDELEKFADYIDSKIMN